MIRQRTGELQSGRTALHKVITQINARQYFFVWSRTDQPINSPISRLIRIHPIHILITELRSSAISSVNERRGNGARLQPCLCGGEILATGDGDGAKPLLVRSIAVIAGSCKRVLGCGGGIAGDLLERVGEVCVGGLGEVLVDAGEVGDIWVGGNGVSDVGAEGEIIYDLAITICRLGVLG